MISKFNYWIFVFFLFKFNFIIAQHSTEAKADSLFFNKSEYYSFSEFQNIKHLRNKILSELKDTLSTNYKIALSKKYAADALFLQHEMKYDSAIKSSQKAIRIIEGLAKQDLFYKAHLHKYLYQQYYDNLNWDKALLHAKKCNSIFKDTLAYNHKLVAQSEFDLGFAHGKFGDYSKVIEYYKSAIELDISNRGEFNTDVAIHEHHLAVVYGFIGYYTLELESYLKVVKRWETLASDTTDMSYLFIAYKSLIQWYINHGDYRTASLYQLKSEKLVAKYQKSTRNWFNETYKGRTKINLLFNKALLSLKKTDTTRALNYNDSILNFTNNFDVNDKNNNPHNLSYYKNFVILDRMKALRFKANLIKSKNSNQAKALYNEILDLEIKDEVTVTTMNDKLNLIELHNKEHDYKNSSDLLDTWIENAKQRNGEYLLMFLMAAKANIQAEYGNIDEMQNLYNDVFTKASIDKNQDINLTELTIDKLKPFSDHNFIRLIIVAAKNYIKAYNLSQNSNYLEISHNLNMIASEIFANNFLFSDFNEATYKLFSDINSELLSNSILLQNNAKLDEVLQKIEESSSKISWENFFRSSQKKYLNIPDSILNKEKKLKRELHFYKKSLFISNDENIQNKDVFKEKIFNIENELIELNQYYKEHYPSYFNQTKSSFSIKSLRQKFKKNEVAIKYLFANENLYAFLLHKSQIKLIKIGSKKEIVPVIRDLAVAISNPNSNYKVLAKKAYDLLLPKDGIDANTYKNIVFILDDILHYIPMEVLINGEGKHLIEKYNISYTSSLLLWNEQKRIKKSRFNKVGVFAPTYKTKYKEENTKRHDSSALLGAQNEAKSIAKLFSADIYLGSKANKKVFIEKAKNYDVLHLAMHSTINNIDAEFSNLRFSPEEKDNKLFTSELYSIPLNAKLAVLSACNTGSGNLVKGKGLINVSNAFTYAGVPSLITSKWSVPDKETSLLMVSLYKYLNKGQPKDEALRLAKLDYLKNTNDVLLKHPYYWAGFIVSGNTEPIKNTYPILLLSIFITLIFLWFFRKKLVKFIK